MKAPPFIWTDERKATMERLYVVDQLSPTEIAEQLGEGCTSRTVIRRANRSGLSKLRDPEVTLRLRTEAANGGSRLWAEQRRRGAPGPHQVANTLGAGRGLPDDLRAAIQAAIAAGKVTILPPGCAAGISVWEDALHTAPPPRTEADLASARRGTRKSMFSRARAAMAVAAE